MKTVISVLICALALGSACRSGKQEPARTVRVLTYDSFTSEWGPGKAIEAAFVEESGITILWESTGDAAEILARLTLEGASGGVDVVLGIDQNLIPGAVQSGLFEPYQSAAPPPLTLPESGLREGFVPFDYSYIALMYDSAVVSNPPRSLEELTGAAYRQKIILLDPRTSSPGLAFLSWTMSVYGGAWPDYWRRLAPSIQTIASSWSMGYGLFLKGEAPFTLSYTTSPAYHLEYEGEDRRRAALFDGGHPMQIEFAGLLAAAPHKENGKRFLDFLLTAGFQEKIPLGNWMYPVIDIPLPASFSAAPPSAAVIPFTPVSEADLNLWADIVAGR